MTSRTAFLLIPAGGKGLRMGGGIPKQFRNWGGVPLLQATVNAFLAKGMPEIQGISLAVPEDRFDEVLGWQFGVPTWVAVGGASRQASVSSGLSLLPERPDMPVMIHDGVRPFPPTAPLHTALAAISNGWDGALLGEASTDTLKRVDPEGRVLSTEPRHLIFRAQTPQVATLATWQHAFAWARDHSFEGTDDVSILEAMGLRVKLVESPASNFKITHPEDWERLS